ncbi:hypothetical protein GCM10011387_13320 [Pedobacter quisquiliarum]|uniref:Uncharacterized protein n=1 Tax=Pedobacter quisquiliarum TaxID=1834438 RepID=A0A916U6L6_9SPHI|nr:hypothetical protein [Pedobacter quisquiliarum]GGC61038.1 hypothetical protein GCM10011387_13320 [Pedobacter quisquiliarum]
MKMLLTAVLLSSASAGFSQAPNAGALQAQIKTLNGTILSLKGENKVLKDSVKCLSDQNHYFRVTLKIQESKLQTATAGNFEFNLMSCKAQPGNNAVIPEFLIVNHGADGTVQFIPGRYADIIDLQGNAYKPSDIKIGAEKYASTVFKEVPLKLTITVNGIDPAVKLLKLVNLEFSNPPTNYKKQAVVFNDITIK